MSLVIKAQSIEEAEVHIVSLSVKQLENELRDHAQRFETLRTPAQVF
jgi:hypothetical protein